jgi:hypothetical protein
MACDGYLLFFTRIIYSCARSFVSLYKNIWSHSNNTNYTILFNYGCIRHHCYRFYQREELVPFNLSYEYLSMVKFSDTIFLLMVLVKFMSIFFRPKRLIFPASTRKNLVVQKCSIVYVIYSFFRKIYTLRQRYECRTKLNQYLLIHYQIPL